jgi:hypothetical protein
MMLPHDRANRVEGIRQETQFQVERFNQAPFAAEAPEEQPAAGRGGLALERFRHRPQSDRLAAAHQGLPGGAPQQVRKHIKLHRGVRPDQDKPCGRVDRCPRRVVADDLLQRHRTVILRRARGGGDQR